MQTAKSAEFGILELFQLLSNPSLINYFMFTDGGSVLVVAHASSLDTCSRQLTGFEPRSEETMNKIMMKVPYCSMVKLQPNNTLWRIVDSPVPSICHSLNKRFDYKILINTEE